MKHLSIALIGTMFGFALSRIGFSDWGEVHRMFTFADWRLTLTFGGAVALLLLPLRSLRARIAPARKRLTLSVIVGAALFGAGWALTGACPSIALVQLGEGRPYALLTLGGVLGGVALHRALVRRWPQSLPDGCDA